MATPHLPSGLSPTSIDLFRQCPRRFEEEKIKGNRSYPGKEAVLGTFVHRILELVMSLESQERTLEAAWECAKTAWAETVTNSDFQRLGLTEAQHKSFKWDARTSVENYFAMEDPTAVDVVATEQSVNCVINGVPLRGIIDRVDRVAGAIVVTDYKNGKVTESKYMGPKLAQLNLYAGMLKSLSGDLPARARLVYTAHSKIVNVDVTEESVSGVLTNAKETWDAVHEGYAQGSFPANPGPLCGWCDAVERCPEGLTHVSELFKVGRLKSYAPAYKLMTTPRIIPFPKRAPKGSFG